MTFQKYRKLGKKLSRIITNGSGYGVGFFYGFEKLNIMGIKLKYKAWIGEKHADIAHKLVGNDIETFALEFAEHLVKNCSIPDVVGRSEQLVCDNHHADLEHFMNYSESICKTCKQKV